MVHVETRTSEEECFGDYLIFDSCKMDIGSERRKINTQICAGKGEKREGKIKKERG